MRVTDEQARNDSTTDGWVQDKDPHRPCHSGCGQHANDLASDLLDARARIAELEQRAERAERERNEEIARLRREVAHLWDHIDGWRGAGTGRPIDIIEARKLRAARAANEAADKEPQP